LACQGWLLGAHLRLARRVDRDPLTGLPGRARLVDRAGRALSSGQGVGLVFVDLDRFKEVNDSHGHVVGDRVLAEVARRLQRAAGPDAFVARYGGDEFAVLVTVRAAETEGLADRIGRCLRSPVLAPAPVDVSASIGAANGAGGTVDDLLVAADAAMYAAKRAVTGMRTTVPNAETAIAAP
ncbi:MAG: GGDEF domain-containing protein, partial [Jiangellaceae bacterium]